MHLLLVLSIVSAALYAWRRASFLGAILLTGFVGGMCALTLRLGGSPTLSITLGILTWAGLLLRNARLRAGRLSI